jgi:glycerate-2-kinase
VIGCNDTALQAAAERAAALGYAVRRDRHRLIGEAAEQARLLVRRLPPRPARPTCVLAGGETFVTAAGSSGRGGRCQEMAVAAATGLAATGWTVLFAGTDGRDGPTDAAGGFVDGTSADRAGRRRLAATLAGHDSYPMLRVLGDLVRTGPTGTNVMDVAIALHPGESRRGRLAASKSVSETPLYTPMRRVSSRMVY